jgi:hypothetical protein
MPSCQVIVLGIGKTMSSVPWGKICAGSEQINVFGVALLLSTYYS